MIAGFHGTKIICMFGIPSDVEFDPFLTGLSLLKSNEHMFIVLKQASNAWI